MNTRAWLAASVVTTALIGASFAVASEGGSASASTASACPPARDALVGVYRPGRLRVLDPCVHASGRITFVKQQPDGDVHLLIALSPADQRLLDAGNMTKTGGKLVAEEMPRDAGHLQIPAVGQYVNVVGSWTHDSAHGWNEIHPIWSLSINGGAPQVSGPQFGGDPANTSGRVAAIACRTPAGSACGRY